MSTATVMTEINGIPMSFEGDGMNIYYTYTSAHEGATIIVFSFYAESEQDITTKEVQEAIHRQHPTAKLVILTDDANQWS